MNKAIYIIAHILIDRKCTLLKRTLRSEIKKEYNFV